MLKRASLIILAAFVLSLMSLPPVMAQDTLPAQEILKIKSEGQEVVNLQMRLRDLGYFNYKVTGYYGTATADAVRLFQEENGLQVDGTVGPETRGVLYSSSAKRYTVSSGQASALLPASRGGRSSLGVMVDWFSKGQYLFPKGAVAKVIDLYTGRSFRMKRTGEGITPIRNRLLQMMPKLLRKFGEAGAGIEGRLSLKSVVYGLLPPCTECPTHMMPYPAMEWMDMSVYTFIRAERIFITVRIQIIRLL